LPLFFWHQKTSLEKSFLSLLVELERSNLSVGGGLPGKSSVFSIHFAGQLKPYVENKVIHVIISKTVSIIITLKQNKIKLQKELVEDPNKQYSKYRLLKCLKLKLKIKRKINSNESGSIYTSFFQKSKEIEDRRCCRPYWHAGY